MAVCCFQYFNDGGLGGLVDFGDEVVVEFLGRDLEVLDILRGTVDDLAGAASGLDHDVQSWVHGVSFKESEGRTENSGSPVSFLESRILI